MTSRKWQPGDVAAIPFGDRNHRAMWLGDGDGWAIEGKCGGHGYGGARPLVVIDPEDDARVSALWNLLPDHLVSMDQLQAALREFTNPTPSAFSARRYDSINAVRVLSEGVTQ